MSLGFDFGTANCSVAIMQQDKVKPIALNGEEFYLASTLSAPNRETVSEYLYRHYQIQPSNQHGEALLRGAINYNRLEGYDVDKGDLAFGKEATALYLDDPSETYYIKSPKSFLGILGLKEMQLAIFEDLVCAMMRNIKHKVETSLSQDVTDTVIGRPINFNSRGGEESNQQAETILRQAATRAGFKNIEFQFEPVAAGLDYEASLTADKNVLVVDIGGGTTDCSVIQMGPSWLNKAERAASMLAHTGQRVGGNDLDIALTFKQFMPEFGKDSLNDKNRPMPTMFFWDPIAINDVEAQRKFYSQDTQRAIKELIKDAQEPAKLKRLLNLHQNTLGYGLVQHAEQSKIALAQQASYQTELDLLNEIIRIETHVDDLATAIATPLAKIENLVLEAVKQANITPDAVYITGGSARSPLIRAMVEKCLPNVPIVSGDFFGSVTSGLARWANLCFK
ncbi:molecular chaperone [Catenovulum sp. SM1970]|uniref:molecular chaperone n=1 Tax=Marinifaba aquimaris TaxID=2741323 RepID=UPI001572F7AD|nr:molecular chaperone [Marinifaba aquimaris]NTS75790.1 molecular chaperone [Marinifaba aquimaris]